MQNLRTAFSGVLKNSCVSWRSFMCLGVVTVPFCCGGEYSYKTVEKIKFQLLSDTPFGLKYSL